MGWKEGENGVNIHNDSEGDKGEGDRQGRRRDQNGSKVDQLLDPLL